MNTKKFMFLAFGAISVVLSSCGGMRYGLTSKVLIESTGGSDEHVNIVAVSEKKSYELHNISLPYRMKVKNRQLPLRVTIDSKNYIYEPFDIKEDFHGGMGGITLECLGFGLLPLYGAGAPLILIGELIYGSKPEQDNYILNATPLTASNSYLNSPAWKKSRDLADIYDLMKMGKYDLALGKSSYLLSQGETGELYYLRGVCHYENGKYKKAIKDLRQARAYADLSSSMRENIKEYLSAAEEKREREKEENRQEWASFGSSLLQATAITLQAVQNNSVAKVGSYNTGLSHDKDYLLDPRYAMLQLQQQYYNEYLQMTNGGQTMTYDEWFQKIKGPALAEQYKLEHSGYTDVGGASEDNTSSHSTGSKTTNGKMCQRCAGTGDCKTCDGKGYYYNSFDLSKKILCPNCQHNHNGRCAACGGTGYY